MLKQRALGGGVLRRQQRAGRAHLGRERWVLLDQSFEGEKVYRFRSVKTNDSGLSVNNPDVMEFP